MSASVEHRQLEEDELSSDAHSGEGEDYKYIEQLSLDGSKKRKHGEILVTENLAKSTRLRLAEIEEVALEEYKAKKQVEVKEATKEADNFKWALLEIEDWGLALQDGSFTFSNRFLDSLEGAVEKTAASLALAKVALRQTLQISYLGNLSTADWEILGIPFSNLMEKYEDLKKDIYASQKRLRMWVEISDRRGVPSTEIRNKSLEVEVEDSDRVNPAGPFFATTDAIREEIMNDLTETITHSTTAEGKTIDGRGILNRFFRYLDEYRNNHWEDAGKPSGIKPTRESLERKQMRLRMRQQHEDRTRRVKQKRERREAEARQFKQEADLKRAMMERRKENQRIRDIDRKAMEDARKKRRNHGEWELEIKRDSKRPKFDESILDKPLDPILPKTIPVSVDKPSGLPPTTLISPYDSIINRLTPPQDPVVPRGVNKEVFSLPPISEKAMPLTNPFGIGINADPRGPTQSHVNRRGRANPFENASRRVGPTSAPSVTSNPFGTSAPVPAITATPAAPLALNPRSPGKNPDGSSVWSNPWEGIPELTPTPSPRNTWSDPWAGFPNPAVSPTPPPTAASTPGGRPDKIPSWVTAHIKPH
ncbi:hypothetical protein F5Y11DRAFT_308552 [Daldinia sp. FL1419]|nr:hypothetical protein F5Y11DRAFT_308552 [Daldinia sp. FL1419]